MGVRGTSVPIQIWNSFPFGNNSTPPQVFPEQRSEKQNIATDKLMDYLCDVFNGQTLLQAYLDIAVPIQPIINFWDLTTFWKDMTLAIIPQGSITYRSVYNVRTHEAEQGTSLRYIAYADASTAQVYHIGIIRKQSQEHVCDNFFV